MARVPIPLIRGQDFDGFKRIPTHGLPASFAEWDKERSQEALQVSRGGDLAVRVEVSPNEFAAFCRARKKRADLQMLTDFIAEKFAREEHEKARVALLSGAKKRGG